MMDNRCMLIQKIFATELGSRELKELNSVNQSNCPNAPTEYLHISMTYYVP